MSKCFDFSRYSKNANRLRRTLGSPVTDRSDGRGRRSVLGRVEQSALADFGPQCAYCRRPAGTWPPAGHRRFRRLSRSERMSASEKADVDLCGATIDRRPTDIDQEASGNRQVSNNCGPMQPDSFLPSGHIRPLRWVPANGCFLHFIAGCPYRADGCNPLRTSIDQSPDGPSQPHSVD